jgi:hypothetical protein
MTEEEAKGKRCCGPEGCGEPGKTHGPYYHRVGRVCIGSACMAWRKVMEYTTDINGDRIETRDTGAGYCGLAGNP